MSNQLRRNERGNTLMIALVVIIVIAVIGGAAWAVMQHNKKNPLSGASPATIAAANAAETACKTYYHDNNLCKFASSAVALTKTAYTATATTTSSGTTGSTTIKSDGKGNFALSGSSGGQSFDSIEIGTTVYIKNPTDGTWLKYGSAAPTVTNPASNVNFTFTAADAAKIQYKSLGTEKCGNLTCYKYQVIDAANTGTTQYVWFDTDSFTLQRWSSKDANGSSDLTFTYGAVTISAPSPVTDMSAAAGASGSGLTQAQIDALSQAAGSASTGQ
jgi:outer membrane lipoprotein-sorting protein